MRSLVSVSLLVTPEFRKLKKPGSINKHSSVRAEFLFHVWMQHYPKSSLNKQLSSLIDCWKTLTGQVAVTVIKVVTSELVSHSAASMLSNRFKQWSLCSRGHQQQGRQVYELLTDATEGVNEVIHGGSSIMLTSVSSSILAPSACSRASKMSREVFPDLWSIK